jgi:hypothetical protein
MAENRFASGRSSQFAQFHLRQNRVVALSGPLLQNDQVVYANAGGGAISLTLPDPALFQFNTLTVQKTDGSANPVTVLPFVAETINGGPSFALPAQFDSGTFYSDGVNWSVFPGAAGASAQVDPRDIMRFSMMHNVGVTGGG